MLNPQITDTIMKKNFEAPYLKVVDVKNDVIATSVGSYGDTYDPSKPTLAPGRRGMMGDETNDEMDF